MIILGLGTGIAYAQTKSAAALKDSLKADTAAANKDVIRTAASLKTGTSQDVLSSFFKLAFADLKDGHHFQFNSSLFAVRAKTDPTLWIDTNYKKQVFARNFVFGIDVKANSNFNFQSTAVNAKYAIINNRDKDIFEFGDGKKIARLMDVASDLFITAFNIYFNENKLRYVPEHDLVTHFFNYTDPKSKTPKNKLPKRFIAIVDSLIKQNGFAPITIDNYQDIHEAIGDRYKIATVLMAQQSLWTIGGQITGDKSKLISKTNFSTEYLKGITKNNTSMGLELDIKANLSIYDSTIVSTTFHRNVFAASAGINWIIYKDKATQKSYVEFKPALAYDNVLSGVYAGETKSRFTADGVLRFRITDDLWIPIDIKYDPKAGKVFGFLNITSNFDWLGSKSKASGAN